MSRAILAIVAAPCFLSMWLAIAVAIRLANNSQLRRAKLATSESREQQPPPRVPDWDVTIPEWAEEQEPGSAR
jgi:hypothetical protein